MESGMLPWNDKSGMLFPVKTMLEIPDELFQRAERRAALENRNVKDLVTDGLRLVLASAPENPPRPSHRMTKAPVSIGKDHTIPVLSNDAMAELLEGEGERLP